MKKLPVLILGLFDTAIMTARCFYGKGIRVYGMDYEGHHLGFQSRLIKCTITPKPDHNESEWLSFVLNWLKEKNESFILIPTSDEFVLLCSKYMNELSQYCLSVIPAFDTINRIIERDKQFNSVIACDIKVPLFISGNINLYDLSNSWIKYPFVIKPINVIEWKRVFNNKGFVINNDDDLIQARLELSQKPPSHFLVQTMIEGDNSLNYEVNSLYLPDGRLFMHTIRKIRQYPDRFGTATCIESFSNPDVEKLAEQLIRKMNLYGFTNIEFKYNSADKQYYYIETNPRVWLQVNFSMKIGINFPLLYYKFLTGSALDDNRNLKMHVKWVDLLPDLLFYKRYSNRYELHFIDFIKTWFPMKSTGLFSLRDPLPFLKDLNLSRRIKTILK